MKTAILFTGFVRSFPIYGEQLSKNLLDSFPNADLYFCAWDKVDLQVNTKIEQSLFTNAFVNCKGVQIYNWDDHKQNIRQTVLIDRPQDILSTNRNALLEGIESTNRIRNQWYLLNLAKKMIPAGKYDVIARIRFDLHFSDVNITQIKPGITIPYNYYTAYCRENHDIQTGFCDHLAYGDEASMMRYLSLYEYFDDMYINHNANIAHAEGILKFYLNDYSKLNINMNDRILYQIIKSPHDINRTPLRVYKYWTSEDCWSPTK